MARATIGGHGQRRRGPNRVNRGGSWNNTADNARAANRNRNNPGNRNDNLGLRLSSTILRTLRNARRLVVTATGPEHRIRPTSRARAHTPFLSGRAEDQAPGHAFGGRFCAAVAIVGCRVALRTVPRARQDLIRPRHRNVRSWSVDYSIAATLPSFTVKRNVLCRSVPALLSNVTSTETTSPTTFFTS